MIHLPNESFDETGLYSLLKRLVESFKSLEGCDEIPVLKLKVSLSESVKDLAKNIISFYNNDLKIVNRTKEYVESNLKLFSFY
ncbi:gp30 [Sphingomonas phage PAU]|uniref:gp30 n=1 Tax=Sphingomonas phage PAU TaxID=1150991 RepID=UPI0002573123|nr:gp30 [Sphingomonas phage PAU]AFF28028.1 gp30 [Sphingomonas phage PAU]